MNHIEIIPYSLSFDFYLSSDINVRGQVFGLEDGASVTVTLDGETEFSVEASDFSGRIDFGSNYRTGDSYEVAITSITDGWSCVPNLSPRCCRAAELHYKVVNSFILCIIIIC